MSYFKIGDVFSLVGGGTPSTKNSEFWGSGIPWISSSDIDLEGNVSYSKFVTEKGILSSTTNPVPAGTVVVVTRVGLGKVCIIPVDMCFSQDMQALIPKKQDFSFSKDFLFYQIKYLMSREKYNGQGTTISGITKKHLADLVINLPSVDEQRRIVSRIEELFSELDNSVNTLQKTKEQLAVYRQAVLKEAFEGKLTEKWREEHPSISISEYWNMICEYKQNTGNTKPYHEDENIELCSLPKEWRWIHVGDISSGPEYGTSQKSAKEGLVPVLRMGNLQNGQIDWEDLVYTSDPVEIEKYYLRPNTILFNRTNSAEHVGKTAIYRGQREAIFAGYLIRINQYDCVDPDYLNYYMNSFVAKSYGKMVKTDGVNQSNIN